MLLPELLKTAHPKMKVGWFLHTPFPSSEIYRTLPVREEVLKAVLKADLIGGLLMLMLMLMMILMVLMWLVLWCCVWCLVFDVLMFVRVKGVLGSAVFGVGQGGRCFCGAFGRAAGVSAVAEQIPSSHPGVVRELHTSGFHTYDYARHFISSCTRILGLEGTPEGVEENGSITRVAAFPIGARSACIGRALGMLWAWMLSLQEGTLLCAAHVRNPPSQLTPM